MGTGKLNAGGNCTPGNVKKQFAPQSVDMHWKTHDCNGKWTCSKRISTSFVFLVNMNHWRGNFCAHNIAGGIKIKRCSACIGAMPLPQFDFFSLPMIELCDIFSLESPARRQVLFGRQPFNVIWAVFVRFFVPAIFYGSRSDSFKFFYIAFRVKSRRGMFS